MAATNSLGSFVFITLETMQRGGSPPVMQEQVAVVQRPGVDGTGFVLLGNKGQPFQMRSVVDVDTYADAVTLAVAYQAAAKTTPYVIVFNSINYQTAFGTVYFILSVEAPSIRRMSNSVGGLCAGGALVEAVWNLVPVTYVAPSSSSSSSSSGG